MNKEYTHIDYIPDRPLPGFVKDPEYQKRFRILLKSIFEKER